MRSVLGTFQVYRPLRRVKGVLGLFCLDGCEIGVEFTNQKGVPECWRGAVQLPPDRLIVLSDLDIWRLDQDAQNDFEVVSFVDHFLSLSIRPTNF